MHPDSFAIAFHHWRATRQFNNVNCYISNGRWKICVLRTQSVFGRRQTTEINWQHWHLKGDQQDDEIRSKHVWELAIKCKFRYLSTTEQHQLHAIAWAQTRIGDSTITATGKKLQQQMIRRISKQIGFASRSSFDTSVLCVCVQSHLNIWARDTLIYVRDNETTVTRTRRPSSLSWATLNRIHWENVRHRFEK